MTERTPTIGLSLGGTGYWGIYVPGNSTLVYPDPNKEVKWGPQTEDEMHLGYVEYIVPGSKPGDPNPLSPRGRARGAVWSFFGGSGSPEPNVGDGDCG